MTDFSYMLRPDAVQTGVIAKNKKAVFQHLATVASEILDAYPKMIADRLAAREKLGSTGFGGGVYWLIGANALLQADYEWSKSEFDGSPIGSLGLDQIEDRQQRAELSVVYRPVFWFSLTPELAYERTSSNRQVREFDDVRVGLIVEFRYD